MDATGICSGPTAHLRFQEWVAAGVFLELWRVGLERYDELKGLDWSWLSLDGVMTKSPLGGGKTGTNPTDWGKQGVKRSLLTEAQGIPVGLAVDGANRHDMKLVRSTLDSLPVPRPTPSPDHPQGLCLDKGYDFDEVRRTLDDFGFTAHISSRGEEAQAIKKEAGFKPTLGGGTHPQLDEPLPAHPGALGQVPCQLHRLPSFKWLMLEWSKTGSSMVPCPKPAGTAAIFSGWLSERLPTVRTRRYATSPFRLPEGLVPTGRA